MADERDFPTDEDPMVRPLDQIGRQDEGADDDVIGRDQDEDAELELDDEDADDTLPM